MTEKLSKSMIKLRNDFSAKLMKSGKKTYKVFYQKKEILRKTLSSFNENPIKDQIVDLNSDFVYVISIKADGLEEAFTKMHREFWSPNGKADPLIKNLGLAHTSMCVGDILIDNEKIMRCSALGWLEINKDGTIKKEIKKTSATTFTN